MLEDRDVIGLVASNQSSGHGHGWRIKMTQVDTRAVQIITTNRYPSSQLAKYLNTSSVNPFTIIIIFN